jgi:hypothetical protein
MHCYSIRNFKKFLSISFKSIVVLPNFIKGIIGIIRNYAVLPPKILKLFLEIFNTNVIILPRFYKIKIRVKDVVILSTCF